MSASNTNKILQIDGAILDKNQLEKHLENIAITHSLKEKSEKQTYPVPRLIENYELIKEVYNLLNKNLKQGITIHPAGEWLLDNFYIIEQAVKQIKKDLTLKKYTNFMGLKTGKYEGFARVYVLASEIVAYTDNKIKRENLEDYLRSYQYRKYLNMEEIWNIGIFMQISIIENIRMICEGIYRAQIQKVRAKHIVETYFENKDSGNNLKIEIKENVKINAIDNSKYSFIEYMSYLLKKYGKKSNSYMQALEEIVERSGMTISEAIRKEHFDIAVKKVSIGNSILSIKEIQRINFSEVFETVNGVEELFKKDPSGIYDNMDYKTKEHYRAQIKEIGTKTKISELYIAKKLLQLAENNKQGSKENHIGYYLIDEGKALLYQELGFKYKDITNKNKMKIYILAVYFFAIAISIILGITVSRQSLVAALISAIIFIIPISEILIQILQYILGKIIKPKIIPKMNMVQGLKEENSTMVVIPTIVKSKEKIEELFRKVEVYYLANKSENLYFTILGDCSESSKEEEEFDEEIVKEGYTQVERLNKKYNYSKHPIFNFVYRKRNWTPSENAYLGWERKRGYLNQFNKFLLGNNIKDFRVNTINQNMLQKIKYIITLDSDTDLVLNSVFELVGAMSHILNKPIIDKEKNIVVEGYGIIQPRVGIKLETSYKNIFTKIFASQGGTDLYTNAISDIYQDNFSEGIFTGKGIYDLEVFEQVLSEAIPENKVLSHDLLEGCYLRCGLATDIFLMDDYPTKYMTYINRLSRWIRGDWQICDWAHKNVKNNKGEILKNPLNIVSKYKIFDNLRRSLFEIISAIAVFYFSLEAFSQQNIISEIIILAAVIMPFLLNILNYVMFKKEGEKFQKTFAKKIGTLKAAIYQIFISIGTLPYKAYISAKSITKALYRSKVSHKNMLEWTTSEEAEKLAKTDIASYFKAMWINVILGIVLIGIGITGLNVLDIIIGVLWMVTPFIMFYISREIKTKTLIETLSNSEKDYLLDVAQKTWDYFNEYLNEENNYLIPDNYQEGRTLKVVKRTSATNIGLSLLAVISAIDLGFIEVNQGEKLLERILDSIYKLQKWNGHLYNWYNIQTMEPLFPRYVSTVDSGNFIGYLYVTKSYLQNMKDEELKNNLIQIIDNIIKDTDFKVLYSKSQRLFSIGFNIEENKLTDSYYDLLASEARQASLVAIAKKDIDPKHWNSLSRTLTTLNEYKGLISWSGTAFEYLMPNINIPTYEGSLIDESCKFMIMSQIEYAKKLGIPWGISESAFNLKDLSLNYQYKAFGIPWLGLKRGLADEMVVSSYGSILAINYIPKEVIKNLKELEKQGMLDKYGFYESIDYTPERLKKGEIGNVVKTYMAHHQALILLSINNLINNQIFQKRFMENPEIEGMKLLLQEKIPETFITTKENKEKIEKIKYQDYEDYTEQIINKIDSPIIRSNVISNENYTIAMNQKGEGFSKFGDIYINRFKKTSDETQGIFTYVKNIKTNKIWSSNYLEKSEKNSVSFMPDKILQETSIDGIKAELKITVSQNDNVEIRSLELENTNSEEQLLEIFNYFEPILSRKEQDYAHPAFNNLFLVSEYEEQYKSLIIKRKARVPNQKAIYLVAKTSTDAEKIGETEYEIDKEKFVGRGNLGIPNMIKNSLPFSKRVGLFTETVVAMKNTIKILPGQKVNVDFVLSVGYDRKEVLECAEKYKRENINRTFNISKAKCEAESRYLRIKGKEIEVYQKMLGYLLFDNPLRANQIKKLPDKNYLQSDLWKYGISGDFPIILVTITDVNDIYVVKQILKAYEFFRVKNIQSEIIILNEENYSYDNYVKEEIERTIADSGVAYMKNTKAGIFVLNKGEIEPKDLDTIKFVAELNIDSHTGKIENAINDMEEEYLESIKNIGENLSQKIIDTEEKQKDDINILENPENLKYFNEYGAFSEDGKEYLISFNKNNRIPTVWSNILANEKFGTVITESGGGYTWYKNSRLNRISSWENYPSLDIPSEVIYLKESEEGKVWSLGANPMPDDKQYNVVYGFGYSKYIHKSEKIIQELTVFVPREEACKVGILTLKNTAPIKKKLELIYYIKPVLGEDEIKTSSYIKVEYEKNNNIVTAKNLYNMEFPNEVAYVSSSEQIKSFTGDKKFFIGNGGLSNPDGVKKVTLNNDTGLGKESCIAIQIDVELESFETKELSIIFGASEANDYRDVAYKYQKIQNCNFELDNIKKNWKDLLERLQVYTPLESMNIILNGWAMYQTISSRLYGRSGFYQSGGAFGFRDQLQDTIGTKYLYTNIMKNQIIKHSSHQFIEGDVEHWWHEETKRGIRTRFSDDLLWLVYLCIEYINFTGDYNILEIETPYLQGEVLKENEDERYDIYNQSEISGTIFEHCIKAIDKVCNSFGEHDLPLIGIGDWNDGFSNVGSKGKGESVWLGFFLYYILDNFIKICKTKQVEEINNQLNNKIEEYRKIMERLKRSLNSIAWDGRWYKRAYCDDGNWLGTIENEECKIDSIAQSWSVISKAGDNDKKYISMESLENHLIDRENGIIKLLDPPFEKGRLNPGYIKAYLAGVRENGGQYTHSSCWAIIAEAMLGFGDKALEYYRMINPIEHARTKEAANKYKVEPYVIAADVYGAKNLAGRGGWTWYTGSSSWYYACGIEYILGLKIRNEVLSLEPCIPSSWKEYTMRYKYGKSIYNIKISNPNAKSTGVEKIIVNGNEIENRGIKLEKDGGIYDIEVVM